MSEAELHLISSRLHGGLLNQARRGDLKMRLPVGLVYDLKDEVWLDPDQRVQETFRVFFRTFERTGFSHSDRKIFPPGTAAFSSPLARRSQSRRVGMGTTGTFTGTAGPSQPRYAGAFAYGRSRQSKDG